MSKWTRGKAFNGRVAINEGEKTVALLLRGGFTAKQFDEAATLIQNAPELRSAAYAARAAMALGNNEKALRLLNDAIGVLDATKGVG